MSRLDYLKIENAEGEYISQEIKDFVGFIGLEGAARDRYSFVLVMQLYGYWINRQLDPARVIHEIKALEALGPQSKTKPPTQFNRHPLKGLWHKHFMPDGISTFARNIGNALKKYGIPEFERRAQEAQEKGEERYLQIEDIDAISHDVVVGNWTRRSDAGLLTGEWIIYAMHEGRRIYLCIGTHEEKDFEIRKMIDDVCCVEFPFLPEQLSCL